MCLFIEIYRRKINPCLSLRWSAVSVFIPAPLLARSSRRRPIISSQCFLIGFQQQEHSSGTSCSSSRAGWHDEVGLEQEMYLTERHGEVGLEQEMYLTERHGEVGLEQEMYLMERHDEVGLEQEMYQMERLQVSDWESMSLILHVNITVLEVE